MNKKGFGFGSFLRFVLFFGGAGLIALAIFTNAIQTDMFFFVVGAGILAMLLGLLWWNHVRKKGKLSNLSSQSNFKPAMGDAQEMKAMDNERLRRFKEMKRKEAGKLSRKEVINMRAISEKNLKKAGAA